MTKKGTSNNSSASPDRNTLRKPERLKSRRGFEFLFGRGKSFSEGCLHITYTFDYSPAHLTAPLMVAFSAPRRKFKRAVDRNYLKRRMREAYRLNKHELFSELEQKGKALVLMIKYRYNQKLDYHAIAKDMAAALERLKRMV